MAFGAVGNSKDEAAAPAEDEAVRDEILILLTHKLNSVGKRA
jgi:hypothetical protein